MQTENKYSKQMSWCMGVAFTFLIASLGFLLSLLPVFKLIGPLASAILIAILYRQFFGYPMQIKSGIQFSSKHLLRAAIILYGLKLDIRVILSEGLIFLLKDAVIITFAILLMVFLAKKFRAHPTISLLLGVGTGVCGAAAIAAIAPIIKSKEEDTAISVGIIALIGTVFAIGYTLLRPILPFSDTVFGIWSGMSLHEIAQVVLAAAPAGEDALAYALLVKLGRVFLLIPLCFIFIFWMKKKSNQNEQQAKIEFPWFLLGFIAMSIVGSYVLGVSIPVSTGVLDGISTITTWLLTAAMVGLGLNVNLKVLQTKALKPVLTVILVSVCVSILSIILI